MDVGHTGPVAHSHGDRDRHDGDGLSEPRTRPPIERGLWYLVGACAVLTLVGLIVLWPGGGSGGRDPLGLETDPVAARVRGVEAVPCSYDVVLVCRSVAIEITEGTDRGVTATLELGLDTRVSSGDGIYVLAYELADGTVDFAFYDFQRSTPMMLLLLLFTEPAQSVSSVVTREVVAVEVIRALVGSIGLVASVPISTWLAARVLTS